MLEKLKEEVYKANNGFAKIRTWSHLHGETSSGIDREKGLFGY